VSDEAPKSLLFLSCDIVGSTAFKQREGTLWQKTFLSFYREFPQILGDLTNERSYAPGFELWKPVGDELIFTSLVRREQEIYDAVRIWLEAMRSYENNVLNDVPLATKGGAFVATFPGPDSRSSIPRDPLLETSDKGVVELNDEALASKSNDYLFDFFGPSIDTGFRVISACSQRYFTLAVEVAWAIAQCAVDVGLSQTRPTDDILLLDTMPFKGVWDGREYPVFAVDRDHQDLVNRALARIRGNTLLPLDIANLCKECSAKDNWPSALYLPESQHSDFKVEPVDSLDGLRSNSMDGAESMPSDDVGTENLSDDAPLGQGSLHLNKTVSSG
jgi:hypothetical protein